MSTGAAPSILDDPPSTPASPQAPNSPPTPNVGPTTAELSQMIDAKLAPVFDQLNGLVTKLSTPPPAPAGPPPAPESPQALLDKFVTDPKGFVQAASGEQLKVVEQLVGPIYGSLYAINLAAQQARVTQKYGEKGWSEVIKPALDTVVNHQNFDKRGVADSQALETLVRSLEGIHDDKLVPMRAEADKMRQSGGEDGVLRGGVRGRRNQGPDADVTDAERYMIARIRETTGVNYTAEEFAKAKAMPNDFDSWKRASSTKK